MTDTASAGPTALPTAVPTTAPTTAPTTVPTDVAAPDPAPRRRPALSPSRAGDFKQCPLLYRFRAIDRLPEQPSRAQIRGTLVHAVLERLYDLPAPSGVPRRRPGRWSRPVWEELCAELPELVEQLFEGPGDPELPVWLESADVLLEAYFRLEDPRRLEPAARELLVETELASGLLLRGYIDRLDVAPTGEIRVVDYKTGAAPRPVAEVRALFQMKFYALALLQQRGVVPAQLRLLYLADGESLTYEPDEAELRRFERTLDAIWLAIRTRGRARRLPAQPRAGCASGAATRRSAPPGTAPRPNIPAGRTPPRPPRRRRSSTARTSCIREMPDDWAVRVVIVRKGDRSDMKLPAGAGAIRGSLFRRSGGAPFAGR